MRRRSHRLALVVASMLAVAACGPASSSGGSGWSTQTSASAGGGMGPLIAAAKAEGRLNLVAVPREWVNYGAIIDGFSAKYDIKVNVANPNGSSQDEVDAVKHAGTASGAPDVLDVSVQVAADSTNLFTRYQVSEWFDIPAAQKESSGLWYHDYGGYMSVGYDSSKAPTISSLQDMLAPTFKARVALNDDPTTSNAALEAVMMASLANGGTLGDIGPGVDFFHQLKVNGNYVPLPATTATIKSGQTQVVFDWDYLSQAHAKDVPTWTVLVPGNATLGGYYAQAINKNAPHPAAARLWEEYLYSNEGQNAFLKGGARPVRMEVMRSAGLLDQSAAAALPPITGAPLFMSPAQTAAAGQYLADHWAQAVS